MDQGAKGFGEHKAGLPIDDPRMKALYEVCDDLRLPVLFHMDDQRGTDKPGLPGLESVLKSFPTVPFIGHGPGFWASISGDVTARDLAGYPRGASEARRCTRSALRRLSQSLGGFLGRIGCRRAVARPRVRPPVPDAAGRSTPVRHRLPEARPGRAAVRAARELASCLPKLEPRSSAAMPCGCSVLKL